jgi:hypothetical protein
VKNPRKNSIVNANSMIVRRVSALGSTPCLAVYGSSKLLIVMHNHFDESQKISDRKEEPSASLVVVSDTVQILCSGNHVKLEPRTFGVARSKSNQGASILLPKDGEWKLLNVLHPIEAVDLLKHGYA